MGTPVPTAPDQEASRTSHRHAIAWHRETTPGLVTSRGWITDAAIYPFGGRKAQINDDRVDATVVLDALHDVKSWHPGRRRHISRRAQNGTLATRRRGDRST